MNTHKTLIVVGGGTGGHVFPLLNLVHYLQKHSHQHDTLWSDFSVRWIGEKDSIESKLCEQNHIPFSAIICGKLRRYFSVKTLLLPFQLSVGIIQSLILVIDEKPTAIFSKGGYVSIPVAIAGWMLRVPVYLHESDSIPGLANRIVARFARGIFCTFPEAKDFFPAGKVLGFGSLFPESLADIAREEVQPNTKTQLLVNCGSQGSSTIFETLLTMLGDPMSPLHHFDCHIVLGTQNAGYRDKFAPFGVTLYDFFYDQTAYFRLVHDCDIVITRSGSSIFEFAALGLHMILIPHPHTGNNHQYYNAKIFEKDGHECILQENINHELPEILGNYTQYKKKPVKGPVNMDIYKQIGNIIMQ